ncbi:hypothetical protein Phage2-1_00055 [Achromobacter phage 2-1]|nr:hypothetical protein Phage2-1_00055 [Achromobacter phage 2-1]
MMLHATDISLHSGGYFDWADIGANSHMLITDVANGLASTARYAASWMASTTWPSIACWSARCWKRCIPAIEPCTTLA